MHSDFAAYSLLKSRKGVIGTYQRHYGSERRFQFSAPYLIPRLAAQWKAVQCGSSAIVVCGKFQQESLYLVSSVRKWGQWATVVPPHFQVAWAICVNVHSF